MTSPMPPSQNLQDLTNEPQAFHLPSPVLDKKSPSLHRTSTRPLQLRHLDSSETIPSEHTSIYDAERVQSEKDESLEVNESDDDEDPNVPPSHGLHYSSVENLPVPTRQPPSLAKASLQALDIPSTPNGRWPSTRLDTIAERLSPRTPRSTASYSDFPPASTSFPPDGSNAQDWRILDIRRRRAFSLDDLDCLQLRDGSHLHLHDSSSSSGEALRAACLCEAYPIRPIEPPPVRVPTPPGLPTFGTREAMEYRMPAPVRTPWVPPWRTAKAPPDRPGNSANTPDTANANEATSMSPPTLTDGLKRLLGMSRLVSPIPEEARRAALPSYLARADDGTYVRGRFGTRHSAHGIGRGPLDTHPFHQDVGESAVPRQVSLARAVEQIDKACAEADQARMASASPRVHDTSARHSRAGSPRLPGQHALTIAEILSQLPPGSPSTSALPPRPIDEAVRSGSSLTFDRMGSGGSIRSQSTTRMDGVRQFVERGERVSQELSRELTKTKKERGGCANCCFAFCVRCCLMEDPDRDVVDASRVMSPDTAVSAMQSPVGSSLRIVREQPSRPQRMLYH